MKSFLFLAGCVLALLFVSPAYPSPSPFTGKIITRIELKDEQGNPWPKPEQALPLIAVKPGDRFTGAAIREGLATLFLKGLFTDIRVEAFPDNGGVRLEYVLARRTIVDELVIHGNSAISTNTIRDALAALEGKEPREEKLSSLRADLLALYQAEGFYDAAVTFRTEPLKESHRVALHADIRESAPTLIEELAFSGNTVFKDKVLLSVLKNKKGKLLKRDLLMDTDRETILGKYGDAGYPAARLGPVNIRFKDSKASVHIQVNEGPRVIVRFNGNHAFGSDTLAKALLIWSERDP